MSKQNYERLSIEVFGRQLITSGDLDPVYIALPKAIPDEHQMYRWLVAYWCFYSCGVASWMSEHTGQEFWRRMMVAAVNEQPAPGGGRWPRASERRHARGQQGINMVNHLKERYGDHPENMVAKLVHACKGGVDFATIAKPVRTHVLFGPWVSFKVGDMLERVMGCSVNFDNADVFIFKDPRKAALMLWREKTGMPAEAQPKDEDAVIREVVDYLIKEFNDLQAPPLYDRPIALQECETVLCCWKSHRNGHYPLFNDIDEINEGLEGWGETADAFRAAMPASSK